MGLVITPFKVNVSLLKSIQADKVALIPQIEREHSITDDEARYRRVYGLLLDNRNSRAVRLVGGKRRDQQRAVI
jgi:hypothetical protein